MQMNILSVAPITAAQFGTNFFYKSLHRQLTGSETMSSRDRVATSFAAGATSAALANPTELVVIRQQQTGLPLSTACYNLFRTHGHRTISVAIVPTMLREGIYASFWMEVCCHTGIALGMNCTGETLACTRCSAPYHEVHEQTSQRLLCSSNFLACSKLHT